MIENYVDERAELMVVPRMLLLLLRLMNDYGYLFVPLAFAMSSSSNLIEFDYKVEADIVPCVMCWLKLMMKLVEPVDLETDSCDLNVGLVEVMCHSDASMIVEQVVGQAGVY